LGSPPGISLGIELLTIGLLELATQGCLLESGYQFLQPFDLLILADFTRLRCDQHRLRDSNIVRQIDRVLVCPKVIMPPRMSGELKRVLLQRSSASPDHCHLVDQLN
jgi:hypothetical protein